MPTSHQMRILNLVSPWYHKYTFERPRNRETTGNETLPHVLAEAAVNGARKRTNRSSTRYGKRRVVQLTSHPRLTRDRIKETESLEDATERKSTKARKFHRLSCHALRHVPIAVVAAVITAHDLTIR